MDSTRERDEVPVEQAPTESVARQDTMPFPPPVVLPTGEVTFGQGDSVLLGRESQCNFDDSSAVEQAFGAPESLDIPESFSARETPAHVAREPEASSFESTSLPPSAPEQHGDYVDFAQILAELDAPDENHEPSVSSALPNPAAALRGQRWIEPKRVSLRASKPDSFRPTTRKIKTRHRAQSAAAVALACGVVIGGAFVGIRVAMSRMDTANAGMLPVPRVTPPPAIPTIATQAVPVPSAAPEAPVAASNPEAVVEAPTSAAALVPSPPQVAAPTPRRSSRANTVRNSAASRKPQLAPSSERAAVPVDEVYVNKSGELVDAKGNPLRSHSETALPSVNDTSGEPPSAPQDDANSPREPAPPKSDEPPKSVDEAQPWR